MKDKINFNKELVKLFSNKTGCGIQYKNCPCNTCFHSIDADFRHICWLIVLGLRGDAKTEDKKDILRLIKKELSK